MEPRRRAAMLTCVLGALLLGSCGGEKTATSHPPQTPTLMVGKVQRVGATVAVSEDLAKACKLQLAEPSSTPKFDFDRSDVLPADREVLARVAECLTTGPLRGRLLQLVGRADSRGESQYNMVLGAHRAGGVADLLAQLGLDRGHLTTTSRGELDAVGTEENGFKDDRRVDILLAQ